MKRSLDIITIVESLGLNVVSVDEDVEGRWAQAHCPFHDDRRPSFAISADHGGWLCRSGCGSGQLPQLVSRLNPDLDEGAAERWLSGFGVDSEILLRLLSTPEEQAQSTEFVPVEFTYTHGKTHPLMMMRGFTPNVLRDWDIGWSESEDPIFGKSIVVPIKFNGVNVGYAFRTIGSGRPKWLYSEGTPGRKILQGWDYLPADPPYIVVTEGSFDALWLYQAGEPAVAVLGSSPSYEQVDLLVSRTRNLVFALDNDEAGQKGTQAALKKLRGKNVIVRTVSLPDGANDIQEVPIDQVPTLIQEAELAI